MSKDGLPKQVINSSMLEAYGLKKDLRAKLERFDQMRKYMQGTGKPAPNTIRLYRADYRAIDRVVREKSAGMRTIETVTWGGNSLIPHDASPKPFALEADAA